MRGLIASFLAAACLLHAQAPEDTRELEARYKDVQKLMAGMPLLRIQVAAFPVLIAVPRIQADAALRAQLDAALEKMPLCSGLHVSLDNGIAAVDRAARWSVENRTRPEEAAADADSLDRGVKDYEGRLQELVKQLPELRAARERLGIPMPAQCDLSEREFEAGLESIRAKIRTLRARATQ